ncbi:helix-turn-helix domain-containing protein [Bacillus velezensis]
MKEKGIQSQKDLADLVGSTEVTISRFKTNTRHIDLQTLFFR